MDFKVNINVCRVCMKPEQGASLTEDAEIQAKFEFTTRLKVNEYDDMPTIICRKCVFRMKIAYEFIQLAHASENNLKSFLAKITNDFQEVTKSTPEDAFSAIEEDNYIIALDGEDEDTNEEQAVCKGPEKYVTNDAHGVVNKLQVPRRYESKQRKIKDEDCPKDIQSPKREQEQDEIEENVQNAEEESAYVLYEDTNFINNGSNEGNGVRKEQSNAKEVDINDLTSDRDSLTDVEMLEENVQLNEDQGSRGEEHTGNDGYLKEYESMLEGENYSNQPNVVDDSSMQELQLYDNAEEELLQEAEQDSNSQTEELEGTDTESILIEEENIEGQDDSPIIQLSSKGAVGSSRSRKARKPHSYRSKQKKESQAPMQTRFYCVKCSRDFSTKTNLTRHMTTHEGHKPFQCTVCGKRFTQNGSLKQHMYTHTGEKPYVCQICNRGFTQCKSLVIHMRRHTGDKPFHCEHCDTFYRQKDGLKSHILKHHISSEKDGNTETHKCITCEKIFENKHLLQRHMNKHVNNHMTANEASISTAEGKADTLIELLDGDALINEKPFISEEPTINIDDIHSAAHVVDLMATSAMEPSRAKKFQCRKCFKCFALRKSLIRHLSMHGFSVSESSQCKTCKQSFETNHALKLHRVLEHKEADINLNECAECQTVFESVAQLNDHWNYVHVFNCQECPDLNFKSHKLLMDHMLEHELNEVEANS